MADAAHVEIVKGGAATVAEWREMNPGTRLDLTGADLKLMDLYRIRFGSVNLDGAHLEDAGLNRANLDGAFLSADLRGTDLTEASLVRAYAFHADFRGANLHGANLTGASLDDARFDGADLSLANLAQASLSGASLQKAQLALTNLSNVELKNVDFSDALFLQTTLAGLDLSTARGLDRAQYRGTSNVDIHTLRRSRGLPSEFLRGMGVSDDLYRHLLDQTGPPPPQPFSYFVSYSTKNKDFADRLVNDLDSHGIRRFYAPEDLRGGDVFQEKIEEQIRSLDKLIVVMSEQALKSVAVRTEVLAALGRERRSAGDGNVLIPIAIDDSWKDTRTPWGSEIQRVRHVIEFHDWKKRDSYNVALQQLLEALRVEQA